MPRLFIGLEVPASAQVILNLKQAGLANTRWIDPSDFHLTLKFVGDVDRRLANDLVETLSHHSWRAPKIQLGELKCFGGAVPSAIYASIQPDPVLLDLVAVLEQLLQQLGVSPDPRRFTPHITIGRCKGLSDRSVADYLALNAAVIPKIIYRPKRFCLYSARNSRGGGPYRVEHSWPFERELDHP